MLMVTVLILLVSAFVLTLPKGKDCLATLIRCIAVLVGTIVPLVLVWEKTPFSATLLISIAIALVLSVGAVALAALGWQSILSRDSGAEEALVLLEWLDPDTYFGSSSSQVGGTEPDDCLFFLALAVVGGLFIAGLLLAGVIEEWLLPKATSLAKRLVRIVLCFVYAVPIHILAVWLVERL